MKLSFPSGISSVNVIISHFFVDLATSTEEIVNEKLRFLCKGHS